MRMREETAVRVLRQDYEHGKKQREIENLQNIAGRLAYAGVVAGAVYLIVFLFGGPALIAMLKNLVNG